MIGSVLNGISVNAAIATTRGSNGTVYTAPANGYAILNLCTNAGTGGLLVELDGVIAYRFSDTATTGSPQSGVSGNAIGSITIYVGPSQVMAITNYSGTRTLQVTGVEFVSGT